MELIQNRVSYYRQLDPAVKQQEESIDIIVPDVNPDVLEIIYASATCTIREKQAGAAAVTVAGDIFIKVFYTSEEEGAVYSLGGQMPYSYTMEVNGAVPGDAVIASVQALSASAHALNPRKLSLKADVGVNARLFQPASINVVTGAEGEPGEGIHTRTTTKSHVYLAGVAEKRIAFNEEIRVMSGNIADSDRIIRSELEWRCDDVKVLAGKAMLRGNAAVTVVTLPENGENPAENTYKLPFSCIVECENANEGDDMTVDFQTLQFETQLLTRNEDELYLYCNIFGNASAFVEKNINVTLVEDVLSTAFELEYETEEVPGGICQPQTLQTEISTVIETQTPAREIVDYCVVSSGCCDGDTLTGRFYFTVLYRDQNGKLCGACRAVDTELPSGGVCPGGSVAASAEDLSVGVDAVGAIEITFTAVFVVSGECAQTRLQVCEASLNLEKPLARVRDASLVLRAIEQGENVWGLAKQYRTSPEAILSANKLESEDELKPGKLVIIPFVG